jgi:hypothetical protein
LVQNGVGERTPSKGQVLVGVLEDKWSDFYVRLMTLNSNDPKAKKLLYDMQGKTAEFNMVISDFFRAMKHD